MSAASRIVASVTLALALTGIAAATSQRGDADAYTTVARGRYLVRAGDCRSCHTVDNGAPFAGGRPVPTPFGVIYSTNLTPDLDTGIGAYTNDDFYRAMHEGIDREGRHLYPAFPYPWFTHMSRADVDAIKAYLDTLPAVRQVNRPTRLAWPMSMRSMMGVWNALYFDAGTYRYDAQHSARWNRGAYLVRSVGHCGACHTDKNFAGAADHDHPLQGGFAEHVYAPDLGANERDGLGHWSSGEIVAYLSSGANAHASAAGPMAEVVEQSTTHLGKGDLEAVADYLKSLPGSKATAPDRPGDDVMRDGAGVYLDRCAGCHMANGAGQLGVFPALRGNTSVQAAEPDTLVAVVLQGARMPATANHPSALSMPGFADVLDDAQIADLLSYIRNHWGNRAAPVDADDVHALRLRLAQAPQ
jgi:mono/diheme cytochrome c family protein